MNRTKLTITISIVIVIFMSSCVNSILHNNKGKFINKNFAGYHKIILMEKDKFKSISYVRSVVGINKHKTTTTGTWRKTMFGTNKAIILDYGNNLLDTLFVTNDWSLVSDTLITNKDRAIYRLKLNKLANKK